MCCFIQEYTIYYGGIYFRDIFIFIYTYYIMTRIAVIDYYHFICTEKLILYVFFMFYTFRHLYKNIYVLLKFV